MRWYINRTGQNEGPFEELTIVSSVSAGEVPRSALVCAEGTNAWQPIGGHAAFAAAFPAARQPEKVLGYRVRDLMIVAGIGIPGMAIGYWIVVANPSSTARNTPAAPVAEPGPAQPGPAAPPTLMERVNRAGTLGVALEVLTPEFKDSVQDEDPATAVLAVWAAKHLDWKQLNAVPSTSHAAVMKDSQAERGKRICIAGTVNEIEVDRTAGVPIYTGGMLDEAVHVYRFHAVRSTEGILAEKPGRLCGIVTGRKAYANVAGGQTKSVQLVGMFDLPANRAK